MADGPEPDALAQAARWRQAGCGVATATVVSTWGSAPRPPGSLLAVTGTGAFAGSVSGGCVEAAVVREAAEVLAGGPPRLLTYGVADETAWELGLACGGRITIWVAAEDSLLDHLLAARAARRPAAIVTRLDDGARALVSPDAVEGALVLDGVALATVRALLGSGDSIATEIAGRPHFCAVHAPPPRLLLVGAVHLAQFLARLAPLVGFAVRVIDPRRAFASPERFPGTEMIDAWPDEAMANQPPDGRTAVICLSHDPKLDDPALEAALRSNAFYIGALGSQRSHAARLDRLARRGHGAAALARIHGPIGLDLGGRMPAEIALAILAQVVQARHRRPAA